MNKEFDLPNYRPQTRVKDIQELLIDPNYFMEYLKEEIDKKIVGEKDTIDTLFTCFMGTKVKNPTKTSFNLLVNDKSGVGKDYITKSLLGIFPRQMWVKRTRISPTALSYLHNARNEPEWTWNGKILYLEDPSNSVLNSEPLKVMASSDDIKETTITIKPGVTRDYVVNGKPVMVVTMARSNPIYEIKRRFNNVDLDSGIDQTKSIMERHTEYAIEGKTIEIDPILTDCIAYLKQYPVKLPFIEEKRGKILDMFPDTLIMRTQLNRFYDYVKARTIISQRAREKIQEPNSKIEWLIGTPEDWDNSIEPFMKTINNPLMIPLTKDEQRLLEIIKNLGEDNYHFVNDIDEKVTFLSKKSLYKILRNLSENNFLDQIRMMKDDANRRVYAYKYMSHREISIKKWSRI